MMMSKKPNGYWSNNKDNCAKEALKYETKIAFRKGSGGACNAARRNGWMDDICRHMEELQKPSGYWNNKERCHKEALKYETRTAFQKGSPGAYDAAQNKGWLDDIYGHMEELRKPNGYWSNNKDNCAKEALKYKTRTAFRKGSPSGAYDAAKDNGWLDDICGHMEELRKPNGYWSNNKDNCHKEALKYEIKIAFRKGSPSACSAAQNNGWLDDICGHMDVVGNKHRRQMYALIFPDPDKSAYAGLSVNAKQRYSGGSSVWSSVQILDLVERHGFPKIIVFPEWYTREESAAAEQAVLDMLEGNGYNVLNACKTGGLGGDTMIWTFDACKKEALKYETKIAFRKGSPGAYDAALNNHWVDDICGHMEELKKPNGYWNNNKERCHKEALKYETRTAFSKGSPSACGIAYKRGWVDDICGHMEELYKPYGYWSNNKDNCAKEALKYETRTAFQKGSPGAYDAATDNVWLDDICGHMKRLINPNYYWSKENCAKEAKKYKTRSAFKKGSPGAHASSRRNNWLNEFFPK